MHQGELKELGRVDRLLTITDVTEVRARGLSEDCQKEIRDVIGRHNGELLTMQNPTTTLEDLFLRIVRESEEHPGRRTTGSVDAQAGAEAEQSVKKVSSGAVAQGTKDRKKKK